MKTICKGEYRTIDPSNKECFKIVEEYHKCTDGINYKLVIAPLCEDEDTPPDCYVSNPSYPLLTVRCKYLEVCICRIIGTC